MDIPWPPPIIPSNQGPVVANIPLISPWEPGQVLPSGRFVRKMAIESSLMTTHRKHGDFPVRCGKKYQRVKITLWLFNIAMENGL